MKRIAKMLTQEQHNQSKTSDRMGKKSQKVMYMKWMNNVYMLLPNHMAKMV